MAVGTGVRQLWAAEYTPSDQSYDTPFQVARLVSASPEIEYSDANNFYADDGVAESIAGVFTGGSVTFTVDGLTLANRQKLEGSTSVTVNGVTALASRPEDAKPYFGVGYIEREMYQGTSYYVPVCFPKVQFAPSMREASTQEEDIEFQTLDLEATIMRDDTADKNYRYIGARKTTATDALADLKALLGVTPTTPTTEGGTS